MRTVGIRLGQPFVEAMLGTRKIAARHVDPQGAEPGRAYKDEKRRVALPAGGQVTESLLHAITAREIGELHAAHCRSRGPVACRQSLGTLNPPAPSPVYQTWGIARPPGGGTSTRKEVQHASLFSPTEGIGPRHGPSPGSRPCLPGPRPGQPPD